MGGFEKIIEIEKYLSLFLLFKIGYSYFIHEGIVLKIYQLFYFILDKF